MAGNQQREVQRVEQMAGGKGHVLIERLLGEKELDGKCRMYAKVTLEPGCSIGYHEHHKESETYYILVRVPAGTRMTTASKKWPQAR